MSRIAYFTLALLVCVMLWGGMLVLHPSMVVTRPVNDLSARPLLQTIPKPTLQPTAFPNDIAIKEEHTYLPLLRTLPIRTVIAHLLPSSEDMPKLPTPVTLPTPTRIPGNGPRMRGTMVLQTERLDFYVGAQTFSAEQVAALAPLIERLLRANELRFGTALTHRVSLGFYAVDMVAHRGVRGMAYTEEGRIEVFYRPYEPVESAAAVAAHELGHHLEAERYGADVQRRADTILHEGLATWIAGQPWLTMCGAPSWKAQVRKLREIGTPLRLLTAEQSGADSAYELWASFVDFLIDRYGWERVDVLYRSGRGRAPGTADYGGVLGKSLEQLAEEWRAWVDS